MTSNFMQVFKKHILFEPVDQIFQKLNEAGFLCWIAGGFVRDFYLQRESEDIDLVTNASGFEVLKLFPEALLMGEEFGVYKIPLKFKESNITIDLALFRKEDFYIDGRRPSMVEPACPEEDAQRRDFTINALFYDLKNNQVCDYVGGLKDLQEQVLKTVGNPQKRFSEDYLRIIRLFRFSAQLNFKIDDLTYLAAKDLLNHLDKISFERCFQELNKLQKSQDFTVFLKSEIAADIFKIYKFKFNEKNRSEVLNYDKSLLKLNLSFEFLPQDILSLYLFILFGSNLTNIKSFQKITKISNRSLNFINQFLKVKSIVELSELNEDLIFLNFDQLKDLSLKKQFKNILLWVSDYDGLDLKIINQLFLKFDKTGHPLITGHDLKDKVSPHEISRTLEKIRLMQFNQKLNSRSEALEIIKKISIRY